MTRNTKTICLTNAGRDTATVDLPLGINDDGTINVQSYVLPPKSTSTLVVVMKGYEIELPPRVTMVVM